jgi:hypothetical protein
VQMWVSSRVHQHYFVTQNPRAKCGAFSAFGSQIGMAPSIHSYHANTDHGRRYLG